MKRKTAKEILVESFRELAETKAIDKIKIQDIVNNCGYSPATFYRNFRDKYDLVAWDYTRAIADIMGQLDDDQYLWRQIALNGAYHFQSHKDYLVNLLRHTSGQESFMRYMTEINYDALKKHIVKSSAKDLLDQQDEMYIRLYCLGTVGLTCEWLLGKFTVEPEEMADIYENALPQPLRHYLL